MKFLSTEKNKRLQKEITYSKPSDIISLDIDQCKALIDLWDREEMYNDGKSGVPSDIFFANTVPLLDCRIEIDGRKEVGKEDAITSFRVDINSNYKKIMIDAKKEAADFAEVGYIICDIVRGKRIIVPLYVADFFDCLVMCDVGFDNINELERNIICDNITDEFFEESVVFKLKIWYGVQIALLHPIIKEFFQYEGLEKDLDEREGKTHKKKKRKVKYIKRNVIRNEVLESIIYKNGNKNNKKRKTNTLSWYVIGHWRTYKNGKTVFIKPYWKGPLKELKKNLEDREREIVLV